MKFRFDSNMSHIWLQLAERLPGRGDRRVVSESPGNSTRRFPSVVDSRNVVNLDDAFIREYKAHVLRNCTHYMTFGIFPIPGVVLRFNIEFIPQN